MSENPRRGRQARNFTTNVPKILDLKSPSEQIFSENWRWVPPSIRASTFTNVCDSPPFAGGRFVQVRKRCWVPLLQVTLHCDQQLHGEKTPSTKRRKGKVIPSNSNAFAHRRKRVMFHGKTLPNCLWWLRLACKLSSRVPCNRGKFIWAS